MLVKGDDVQLRIWARRLRFAGVIFATTVGLGGAACSSDPSTTEVNQLGSKASPQLFGGTATNAHPEVGFTSAGGSIAGVIEEGAILLAPTLAVTLVTAVAKNSSFATNAICGTVSGLQDPSEVTFILGDGATNPPKYISGSTGGTTRGVKQIITNGEVDTCKGPLAFLVLDSPIDTVTTFPKLELDALPAVNDALTECTWGEINTQCAEPTSVMCASGNIILPNGGYFQTAQVTFPQGQIVNTVDACGDEGGAVFGSNGGLLAIAGLNTGAGGKDTLQNPCGNCQGDSSSAILFSSQASLVVRAFAAIGSSPWRVGHQQPAAVGGTCTDALDCNSQECVQVGNQGYCSQDCSTTACPTSTVCTQFASGSVCLPEVTPHPQSCDASPMHPSESTGTKKEFAALLLFGGFIVYGRRRRNQKKASPSVSESRN
jgi:hypothetical protein